MRPRAAITTLSAAIALVASGSQLMLAMGGLASVQFSGGSQIAATTYFGADLSSHPYPNEVGGDGPQTCDESPDERCTRVMRQAYGTNGRLKAPRDGMAIRLRIIALEDGTARLYFARLDPSDPNRAKVVRRGPSFSYDGQLDDAQDGVIDTIDIPDVVVHKNEVIAVRAVKFSGLQGGSGGNRHLEFQPPLAVGEGFRDADDDNSYFMLVRVIMQ